MPDSPKIDILDTLTVRFGKFRKLADSQSLFEIGDNAARVYFRYSKLHPGRRTFFGLRKVDLHQLEGHNSFICFLVDDGSLPVFVPYTDFEELFRMAEPAKDGQLKAQLISQPNGLELYIARQGRFNVESYIGFDGLTRSLDARKLKQGLDLTHSQAQTLLAGVGHMKGYDVYVPSNDAGKMDWSLTRKFSLLPTVPKGYTPIESVLSEIDVLWIASGKNTLEGLFEVEHSTPVYSGLLRFNDVLLANPRITRYSIVSNDSRRELFSRQAFRPTFRKSGLSELVGFLEYANVYNWHGRMLKGGS